MPEDPAKKIICIFLCEKLILIMKLRLNKYLHIGLCSLLLYSTAIAQENINMKDQHRKAGPVYFISKDNQHAMLSISVKQHDNRHYYTLLLHDLQNVSVLKQRETGSANDPNTDRLIGKMGNIFWMLTDSLVGYDVYTLQPVVSSSMIAEKNSFMLNNFSLLPNSYLLDEAAQVLYITAENGDRYKLYPDLSMKPDDTSSDLPDDENFSYEFAAEYKVNDRYQLKYALSNVDTSNQHLFILGSDKETGNVLSYYGTSIYADNQEMRKLTIIAYNMDGEKIDYSTHKPVTINKQYFRGAFLQKKFFATTWHGNAGERIILHEEDKKLVAALIDKGGNEKWKVNTQEFFNNFIDYLINDKYFIGWFIAKGGETFVCIDLETGVLVNGK